MTVENQFPYQSFTANGSQTNFTLGFYVDDKNHFEVKKNDQAVSKNDYNYNKNSNSIEFNTTPKNGDVIEVQRSTAADRATNYATYNNSLRPEVLNKDIDRIWLKIQELGVADFLLKIYADRLHSEQKGYIDNQDQAIRQIVADLRNYVYQQDNSLSSSISNLKSYVDLQDNQRNNYFSDLIYKQGISLQQLNNYYNNLMQRIAAIAVDKGWEASFVSDTTIGKTQTEINQNTYFTVSSLAKLKNLAPSKKGQRVYLESVIEGNGKGGGTWVATEKEKLVENNAFIVNSPNSSLVWVRTNYNQVIPEFWGCYGDGKTDDTDALQHAINWAATNKSVLVLDNKYLISKQITSSAFGGISSNNRGTIIVNADVTAFKFTGIEGSKWFERILFEYNVPTTNNNATILIDFEYHVIGMKIRDIVFNGKPNYNWTGTRVTGRIRGFFGGFEFSNNRSHYMYADLHFASGTNFTNSGLIQNNFKFYGLYGILIDADAGVNNLVIKNYQAQECTGNTICANGGMHKCTMELIYNWDNFNPAIYLGKYAGSNLISATYPHDITNYGLNNVINVDNKMLATDTAIAASIFVETAQATENSFKTVFNKLVVAGNAKRAEGTHNELGSGRGRSGLIIYTAPKNETETQDGYFLLDNENIQVPNLTNNFYGKYDRYSSLEVAIDFDLLLAEYEDNAFSFAIGGAVNSSKPTRYFGITVLNNKLCVVQQTSDSTRTVIATLNNIEKGRYSIQMRSGPRQSLGEQNIYVNNKYVATATLDLDSSKRPFIEVKSTTKSSLLSLISCRLTNRISEGIKAITVEQ